MRHSARFSHIGLVPIFVLAATVAACGKQSAPSGGTAQTSEAASEAVTSPSSPAAMASVAAASLAGNVDAGKATFAAKCVVCHSLKPGTGSAIGPHIGGVTRRDVASVPGFAYSPALKAHGGKWDTAALDHFLKQPQTAVPGTMMAFSGLLDAQERANVIAYLEKN